MTVLSELARPKVNLTLKVRGRRPDGYHELESLVAFASGVGDRLSFTPGGSVAVRVSGPFGNAILGENLVERALQMLGGLEPRLALGSVLLEKNLPVSAGIGGGSADAAAALRLVRTANPNLAGAVDWQAIALALGADVPVCFEDRPAVMCGIGERLFPISELPRLSAVLVNPLADVPTAKSGEVFRRLEAPPLGTLLDEPCSTRSFRDAAALVEHLRNEGNDLAGPARAAMPEIDDVLHELEHAPGTILARLSGAGPTAFGIYASGFAALAAAREIALRRPGWWVQPVWLG
jgi:4-diphosphocytidyl-2-C-methyl-D-erythritol kinase